MPSKLDMFSLFSLLALDPKLSPCSWRWVRAPVPSVTEQAGITSLVSPGTVPGLETRVCWGVQGLPGARPFLLRNLQAPLLPSTWLLSRQFYESLLHFDSDYQRENSMAGLNIQIAYSSHINCYVHHKHFSDVRHLSSLFAQNLISGLPICMDKF